MEVASTGIQGLDGHLSGGIPRGTTLLVIAEPDNALPTFCEQFAGGGVNGGEQIVYFQLDRPTGNLRKEIAGYAVNAENARKATLKLYDAYAPQFGRGNPGEKQASFAAPLSRQELFPAILREMQAAKPGGFRLVVESLSSFVTEKNEDETLEFVRTLCYLGHELQGVQLISIVKGLHSPRFEQNLKHIVPGVVEIGTERKSFGLYPYMFVQKMLGAKDPVRIFPFKETEKGLALETSKRL